MNEEFNQIIFTVKSDLAFNDLAIKIFRNQAKNNTVYRDYLLYIGRNPETINDIFSIPFLPIKFFRNHKIVTGEKVTPLVFRSSGTTGIVPGKHYISDVSIYEQSFLKGFNLFYGDPAGYCILALLPSYSEREGSSLIYMMERLVKETHHKDSGFYLKNLDDLVKTISRLKKENKKILLIGVSFALLELSEKYSPDLSDIVVMETGGMKGMRKELVREELHEILCRSFNINNVHSEYGMTELLSQAYSPGEGVFSLPPWMRVVLRDPNDPLTNFSGTGISGGINIIDLANINSCSFIATDDLGHLRGDGNFEVLGRFDNSDIRGCNLLV